MRAPLVTSSTLVRTAVPILGGAGIAAVAAVLLSGRSPLWVALPLCAGLVVIPSIVVKDRLAYWLCLLLLTFPFDISKTFMEGDRAIALVGQFGGPPGPVALNVHLIDLALLPLLVAWLLRKFRSGERIWFPRISYVPLTCMCFVTVTATVAPSPYFAFLALIKQWKYFVIYLFAADAFAVRRLRTAVLVILVPTLLFQATLTLARYRLQYFEPFFGEALGRLSENVMGEATRSVTGDKEDSQQRGFGTFYHANPTAMHLELLLPFALALALSRHTRWWRFLYVSAFVLGAAALYVTFSRAGMAAFLGSTLICLVVSSWRGLIPRRVLVPLTAASFFAGLCLVPALVAYMRIRPEDTVHHMQQLQQAMIIFFHHPIFGVGLNNSSMVRPYLIPGGVTNEETQLPLHSGHLLGLSETGVIGFGLYLGFFVLIAIEALRQSRSRDVLTRTFAIAILGAYTAMGIHMTTDYMGVEAFFALLWMCAGLVVAQRRDEAVGCAATAHALVTAGRAQLRAGV